jgi:hypothetical protein
MWAGRKNKSKSRMWEWKMRGDNREVKIIAEKAGRKMKVDRVEK